MLSSLWIAALAALFLWWFSTGVILMLVRHSDQRDKQMEVAVLSVPLLALGGAGIWATSTMASVSGAYLAFLSAIAVWGWIELSFLSGVITGPNRAECPPDVRPWERFIRAWGTIAYHEMALGAALVAIGLVVLGGPNAFGFWTFSVLFFARISAKLNLFLGVPKINLEFLPTSLSHLPSHFRIARMNWLFPVSITALSFAVACWLERIHASTAAGDKVGFVLLAALTALALFEHWMMVLPVPDEKLWRWMLPAPKALKSKNRLQKIINEEAHGL
ncbi:MAG: DUF3623 domain-containing protein [Litoreibacter sp.]|nr:DUF3623 domain-containing protein [Litoreibacter sp.]